MAIHKNKNDKSSPGEKEISQRLRTCEDQLPLFQSIIGTLFVFIKEFSLDLKEIDADAFKDDIEGLSEEILSGKNPKKSQAVFEKHKKTVYSYIERLKKYLDDRENELKDIIDLLTKAMATVDADNQVFNQQIYKQSEKIEEITLLDDIKKIKSSLKQEIEQVRKAVKEKQTQDRTHLEMLSKKVDSLNVELEKAVAESLTDGLTGAYNRLAFDKHMKGLVERNLVTKAPFSLILLDIDDFKDINDSYGHLIGDRVILALIQKCGEITRQNDCIARFGGDEFAIVMSGASLKNASKKAKQLSKAVAGTRYAVTTAEDSLELSFTVSMGVSEYRKGDTVATVTERADKALYTAKHSGKARVVNEKEMKQ